MKRFADHLGIAQTAVFRHARRVAVAFCIALALLTRVGEAAPAAHRAVFLEAGQGAHPSLRSVLDATRGPLAELSVELLVAVRPDSGELSATTQTARKLAASTQAVAVIWLDVERRGTTRSVLYFFDPLRSRLLTRQLEVSDSEAAAAEEVAVVLRSAISALLEGEEVAMTEVAVPELKPAAPPRAAVRPADSVNSVTPARPNSDALGLDVGLAYVGSIFTEALAWQSGGRLSLSFTPPGSRWRAAVAYEFLEPLEASSAGVVTRVTRHPVEVALARELLGGKVGLAPEFALILDAVRRRTEQVETPLVATEPSTRWLWAVSTRLRVRRSLATRISLFGVVGADFVLNPFEQVAADSDSQTSVSSLLAVRPRLEAGLLLEL